MLYYTRLLSVNFRPHKKKCSVQLQLYLQCIHITHHVFRSFIKCCHNVSCTTRSIQVKCQIQQFLREIDSIKNIEVTFFCENKFLGISEIRIFQKINGTVWK